MTNVQQLNRTRPADWPYTAHEMELIRAAVQAEANPPAQRSGVGPVVRRRG